MAEASVVLTQGQFNCPICLDLLKDPVTIPCGHNYCMRCITCYWDQDEQRGAYTCPQCRKTFASRPALYKNSSFEEMVEKLKQVDGSSPCGDGEVECDICPESKQKAIKSCLECVNSYCRNHLQQHDNVFKEKSHRLIDAPGQLQQMICPQHNKYLEVFCRTDRECICVLCKTEMHRNHDTVPAAAEMSRMQGHLGVMKKQFQQRIGQRELELQKVREAVESHKHSAQVAVENTQRIFNQLISSMERSCSEMTQLIRDQEKTVVSQAEGLVKQLELEIEALRRRDAQLEEILHPQDHIHFLQSFKSLSVSGLSNLPRITVSSLLSFDDVGKSLNKLRDRLQNFCGEEIKKVTHTVKNIQVVLDPVNKNREEYLKYFRQFTLDLNTVNRSLRLSEENRVIRDTNATHQYPEHPDRFHGWKQVLCNEGVTGHCYCEIELMGSYGVSVSMSYKSISRKGMGDECRFGYNDQSWSLFCSPSRFSFCHNKKVTNLPVMSSCSRMGVYVDHSAGTLAFYSISDTMTLIHRVQTTFTKPLHLGLGLSMHSTVKLCLSAM